MTSVRFQLLVQEIRMSKMRNILLKMTPALAARMRQEMKAEEDEGISVVVEGCDPSELEAVDGEKGPRPEERLYFVLGEDRYPAALVNLPCNVEAMKTLDGHTYFKSSDIGQALVVYESEEDRDLDMEICETLEFTAVDDHAPEEKATAKRPRKERRYYHSGLTPPSLDVVRRRFRKTKYWDADRAGYDRDEIRAVCLELEQFLPPVRKGRNKKTKREPNKEPDEPILSETVYETVIDMEELISSTTARTRRVAESEESEDANGDVREVPLETLLENYPAFARYLLPTGTYEEVEEEVKQKQKPSAQKDPSQKMHVVAQPTPVEALPKDDTPSDIHLDGHLAKAVEDDILYDNDDFNALGFDFEKDDLIHELSET